MKYFIINRLIWAIAIFLSGCKGAPSKETTAEHKENELIEYTMSDGRQVTVNFISNDNETKLAETFDAENTHPVEMQRSGWQAILDSFKKYVEEN